MKNTIIAIAFVVLLGVGSYMLFSSQNKKDDNATTGYGDNSKSQKVQIKGSDTEVQLVSTLAESYGKKDSSGSISVAGGGSGVGIAALINGEIDVANASRPMKDKEKKQASDKNMTPGEFIVCRDGLSVITHKDNSVSSLTLEQLGKIYRGEVKNWKEVGGADKEITLYGRQSTSGTFSFFRSAAVNGEYATSMKGMEGNSAIVDAIKTDMTGIGYVGVGYVTGDAGKDLTVVKIAKQKGDTPMSPLDKEAVLSGAYPLNRPIYQYTAQLPAKDSYLAKFLRYEVSEEGQKKVEEQGFYPINDDDKKANEAFFASLK